MTWTTSGNGVENDHYIDFADGTRKLIAGWKDVLTCTGLVLILAIVYLHVATYVYTAQITLVPTQAQSRGGLNGQLSSLASMAGVNLSSLDQQNVSPFSLYSDALKSSAVADDMATHYPEIMHRVFRKEWDESAHRWKAPGGVIHSISTLAKLIISGRTAGWRPPGGSELREFISKRVQVDMEAKRPVVTINYNDPDPAFARSFLEALNDSTDRVLRNMTLDRSSRYARYLQDQLATVQQSDLRMVLVNSLSAQETLIMMGNADTSFAAQPLGNATSSIRPTRPVPFLILAVAFGIGVFLGGGVALLEVPVFLIIIGTWQNFLDILRRRGRREYNQTTE